MKTFWIEKLIWCSLSFGAVSMMLSFVFDLLGLSIVAEIFFWCLIGGFTLATILTFILALIS